LPTIVIQPIDSQSAAELHERHVQAQAEADAIAEEQSRLAAAIVEFRERNPADVVLGDAEKFRDRQTAILARELRLRHSLRDLDRDLRADMGGRLRELALTALQEAEKRVANGLHKLGFAWPDKAGSGDQVILAQLVQRHPAVIAARGRVQQLGSRSSDGSIGEQNRVAIAQLSERIRQSQLKAAQV
jgi:hypothetical protein